MRSFKTIFLVILLVTLAINVKATCEEKDDDCSTSEYIEKMYHRAVDHLKAMKEKEEEMGLSAFTLSFFDHNDSELLLKAKEKETEKLKEIEKEIEKTKEKAKEKVKEKVIEVNETVQEEVNSLKAVWRRAVNYTTEAFNKISQKISSIVGTKVEAINYTNHTGQFRLNASPAKAKKFKTKLNLQLLFNLPLEDLHQEIGDADIGYSKKAIFGMLVIHTTSANDLLKKAKGIIDIYKLPLVHLLFPNIINNMMSGIADFDYSVTETELTIGLPADQLTMRLFGLMLQYIIEAYVKDGLIDLNCELALKRNIAQFIKASPAELKAALEEGLLVDVSLRTNMVDSIAETVGKIPEVFNLNDWNSALGEFLKQNSTVNFESRHLPEFKAGKALAEKIAWIKSLVGPVVDLLWSETSIKELKEKYIDPLKIDVPEFPINATLTLKFETSALSATFITEPE